ncbi:60 kDa chaperonin 1 [archaeon]|nr:60 kDa chaperonin 1 [archaeon]
MMSRDIEEITNNKMEIGKNALKTNITAALAVSESLKSTFGPKGMDKMLVTDDEIVITNSGSTILELMELVHPAAKMMAELGKTQGKEFGDGTTASVIIAGELLKKALELVDMGIHQGIISSGYKTALSKSLEFLDSITMELELKDIDSIALTMLRGKITEADIRFFSTLVNAAVNLVRGDKDRIYINYRPGGGIKDSTVFDGVYIDLGKRVHPSMPRNVKNARILLIDREFDLIKPKHTKLDINSVQSLNEVVEYKKKVMRAAVGVIARSSVNVVLCSKNIAEEAMFFMAKAGILGVRDVEKKVMQHIAEATGAKVLINVNEVSPDVLGYAGYVEESKIGNEEIMYIKKPKYPNMVASILIRAGNKTLAIELMRKMKELVEVLCRVAYDKKILPGGGATELELAERLRIFSRRVPGKEQLAIKAFAEALEEIPKILAKNAGINPIDILAGIKRGHYAGFTNIGFNAVTRKVGDTVEHHIFDSYAVKRNAIISATEVASLIVRVDDVFMNKDSKVMMKQKPEEPPQQIVEPPITPQGKFDLRYALKGLR